MILQQRRHAMSDKKACLVIGAGDATGGAIARRFAREGFAACVTRRPRNQAALDDLAAEITKEGGTAHAFGVDARDEDQMIALFDRIESKIAPLDVVVFNVGANVWFPIGETTAQTFQKVWEMACFAGFITGREAARRMEARGGGTVIFTGATASLRGSAGFSAFASAKAGLRNLAQSMARELGPKGIHVAHTIIDGMIDTAWGRENFPDAFKDPDADNVLKPDDIAENYWQLHCQPRNAWTFELDLRPYCEKW